MCKCKFLINNETAVQKVPPIDIILYTECRRDAFSIESNICNVVSPFIRKSVKLVITNKTIER